MTTEEMWLDFPMCNHDWHLLAYWFYVCSKCGIQVRKFDTEEGIQG